MIYRVIPDISDKRVKGVLSSNPYICKANGCHKKIERERERERVEFAYPR